MSVLVLDPAVSYGRLDRAFVSAGWRGGATTRTAALMPGEPEVALWRRGSSVARYDVNPVVWLRVLRVVGPDAAPELPRLTDDVVLALLHQPDRSARLLGILAATELRLTAARTRLAALALTRDPVVAGFAAQAAAASTAWE